MAISKWFRFWDEVVDDPKVQLLSPNLFKAWVNFLCIANKNTPRGELPSVAQIAYRFHSSKAQIERLQSDLIKAGLLDTKENERVVCHNWNGRQFESDRSTIRVQRFRERSRNVSGNATPPVTGNVSRNVSETVERNVSETVDETPQTRPDQTRQEKRIPPYPLLLEFDSRWAKYPVKDGKADAQNAWKATVKTPDDLVCFDRAQENYRRHLEVTGYTPKNGKTFFRNWRDFVDWQEVAVQQNPKERHHEFARPDLDPQFLADCQREIDEMRREDEKAARKNGNQR